MIRGHLRIQGEPVPGRILWSRVMPIPCGNPCHVPPCKSRAAGGTWRIQGGRGKASDWRRVLIDPSGRFPRRSTSPAGIGISPVDSRTGEPCKNYADISPIFATKGQWVESPRRFRISKRMTLWGSLEIPPRQQPAVFTGKPCPIACGRPGSRPCRQHETINCAFEFDGCGAVELVEHTVAVDSA